MNNQQTSGQVANSFEELEARIARLEEAIDRDPCDGDTVTALTSVTQKVIVQNEVGTGKNLTEAVALLSTRPTGVGYVMRGIRYNNSNVSPANPLPAYSQGEVEVNNDRTQYRWVRFRYRVNGGPQVLTAPFLTVNPGVVGPQHFILQVIMRPRSEDGSYTQAQIDGMV